VREPQHGARELGARIARKCLGGCKVSECVVEREPQQVRAQRMKAR
jgi:hypothetical protein